MAAVPHFIQLAREHLPLAITRSVLNEHALLIGGENWLFATSSAWRVASAVGFNFGSGSNPTEAQVASLIGQSIIAAEPFGASNLDPSFILSNGSVFESFSATDYEPWELRLPGDIFILADGSPA